MRRQGRGCKHQSCAANPTGYSALVAFAVILPGRLGVSDVDVFAVLCPLLFGLWSCSPLVGVSPCSSCRSLLSLFRVVLAALLEFFSWLSRWFRGLSGRASVLSLPSPRPSFLVFCLRGPRLLYFADFNVVTYFGRFLWHFPSCGVPARWRVLPCVVFRHLRQVVFHLAGSLGVFLNFAAPDPGGC